MKNIFQQQLSLHVANGITKIYIGNSYKRPPYNIGDPVFIYRRHRGKYPKYKSCITSYCVVSNIEFVKQNNRIHTDIEELWNKIKNKTVFKKEELIKIYNQQNVLMIEMLYYGHFGEGNNINNDYLINNGYWTKNGEYPTEVILNKQQFIEILKKGNINVSNVIIN